ncbi:hypothetical protein RGB72_05010 [Glutamicibacter protophormiae]|nr:hypothetical protein D8M38_11970 [Kocuria sp. HSID17582]WNB89793.1 hypothetical protein RGB72_05010 [Glutamicibacter protophormiae]
MSSAVREAGATGAVRSVAAPVLSADAGADSDDAVRAVVATAVASADPPEVGAGEPEGVRAPAWSDVLDMSRGLLTVPRCRGGGILARRG